MPKDRRAFEQLPDTLKTTHNNREYWIADDPLYEPERAEFVIGWIGDTSVLSEEDLERTPPLPAPTPAREKYQLGIGATYIDPATQQRLAGAFYQDLVGQIEANGGIVGDDPNRVFSTRFYSWAPPFDFDKHVNFGRYFWVGDGAADVNGEFITKEPAGSRTVLHEWTGSAWVTRIVSLNDGLPASGSVGDYAEDSSQNARRIFRWDGMQWVGVDFLVAEELPEDTSDLDPLDTYYLNRTGPDYNRPIIWEYTEASGRWHPRQVVVAYDEPAFPREGMLWEDANLGTERIFKRYTSGFWAPLTYGLTATGPSGTGSDGDYLYDIRDRESISDEWGSRNWWRHAEDLSPKDVSSLNTEDQATRPIIEFWHGVEQIAGDTRTERNQSPQFKKYAFDTGALSIVDTGESTTIYEYQRGTGQDDFVLGFPLSFNDSGEFLFELTLESDTSAFAGYKYFKDTMTGLVHSVWHKSSTPLMQEQDADGFWSIPKSITSNPDHTTLTTISRSRYLRHFGGIMEAQDNFTGSQYGPNSFRWSKKDPAIGATIIDNEQSLLRSLALLQTTAYNLPDAIRHMGREYNRVLFKFGNMLTQMWNAMAFNGPDDTLTTSAEDACDIVLTRLFLGRTPDFPYYYSDMGTFVQKQIFSGVVDVIDPAPQPIFIPPSAPRVGTAKAFAPQKFTDWQGNSKLRGHDGSIRDAYGDDRDLVWLELENRFFAAIPADQTTETNEFSARFLSSNFFLQNYYGNYEPTTPIAPVDQIVEDYTQIVNPPNNSRVFSTLQGVYAVFGGGNILSPIPGAGTWLTRPALTDEVFLNNEDGEYYIFNGQGTHLIERFNRSFDYDYSDNEFRRIIRREFERWVINAGLDFMENTTFDQNDPFTWNYGSAGVEGHFRGQYRRLYHTIRPHSHPWEVVGYSIEPDWWRTTYVPTSTASDGTPRYANTHPMWADFQAGIVNPNVARTSTAFALVAPIPVDAAGELLDPIAAGVVAEEKLDKQRIDDTWVYGDGAPVEEQYYDSVEYPFAVALAGYLMKNGIWVDTVWTEVFIEIGLFAPNQVFNAPHLVHRQTLTRPALADLPVHLEVDDDGNTIQRVGVNAWISESIQINGGSPTSVFGDLLRGTTPALSWRASGFVNGDRTIVRTLGGKEVPFEDVHVVLHQSQPVRESFASGVLITREEPGYRIYGFDTFNPVFTIEVPAIPVIGGQATLTEETIAEEDQHLFTTENVTLPVQQAPVSDTAGFVVMVNGVALKPQHVKVNSKTEFEIEPIVFINEGDIVSVQIITTTSNPSTQTRNFYTSQGVAFPYFTQGTGQYIEVEYGRYFSSSVDVVNFLLGYGRWLEAEGWQFQEASPDGSERLDYLYIAKLFAEWVVDVESPWNPNPRTPREDRFEFRASPFSRKAEFSTSVGQTLNVEAIQNGAYGLVDHNGAPIPADQTMVSRVGPDMTIDATGNSDIYGVRVLVTEIEHVVFFSNITEFNDIMYDPPSALFHQTLRVDTYRSQDWNGRLEADGFLINGGELLPNFEKQAKDIIKFYDRFDVVDDPTKYNQAKNLYGWYPSDEYMDPIDADERSRLDYYRGMIKAKGTRRAFKAYWRGTRLGTDDIFLYEEWAWLLAQFGDPRRAEYQFRVGKNDFTKEFQVIAFVDDEDTLNNTLEVVPFNRNLDPIDGTPEDIITRSGNGRWVRPPIIDDDLDGIINVRFPFDPNTGLPLSSVKFFAKLFEEESLHNLQTYFHYDPAAERYEPVGMANVDYVTITDPARYNNGPDAAFSGGRIWTDDRVGQIWWDVERNTYSDYRSLLPDYEVASTEWGRLEFFNARIERTDNVARCITLDPFVPFDPDGTPRPVEHGLRIGQRISVRGSNDEEYNVEDLIVEFEQVFAAGIEMANTNEASGTIDFTLTQAVGDTQSPIFQPGDGCIVETESGTIGIVLETGGLLDDVVNEINDQLVLKEVIAVNQDGKLSFRASPDNENEWFTLRENTYQFGCTQTLRMTNTNSAQLLKIEFPLNGVDQANGEYLGLSVNGADNPIDDLRVIDLEFGEVELKSNVGHYFNVGDEIRISGVDQTEYNGIFLVSFVDVGVIRFRNPDVIPNQTGPATGDAMIFSHLTVTTETFSQNVVLAINRKTDLSGFSAEYLGASTFKVCTTQSREDAEATEVRFTFDADLEKTEITCNDASTILPVNPTEFGKYFRLNSALDETRYYVWYSITTSGVAEQTQFTIPAGSAITDGEYFTINAANNSTQYYVWYNVDGGGSDPTPPGLTPIEVAISSGDSADDVTLATKNEIDLLADFNAVNSADPGQAEQRSITCVPASLFNLPTTTTKYFELWSANDATQYYVWFDIDASNADPFGSVREITQVVCKDASFLPSQGPGLPPGNYWSIYTVNDLDRYYIWYNVTTAQVQEETTCQCLHANTLPYDDGTTVPVPTSPYWTLSSAGDANLYYVWYRVTSPTAFEETDITCTGAGAFPAGGAGAAYFEFNAAEDTTQYYVWYDVTDAGGSADPLIPGKTGIRVPVLVADPAPVVAANTVFEIQLAAAADVTASDLGGGLMKILNNVVGATSDTIDGATPTAFVFLKIADGMGALTKDPLVPGRTGIMIDVDRSTDDANTVAGFTAGQIQTQAPADFTGSALGNTATIVNTIGSVVPTAPADGAIPTGFTIGVSVAGTGTPNSDPMPGGTFTNGIRIDILPTDDADAVCAKTATQIATSGAFDVGGTSGDTFSLSPTADGAATDSSDIDTTFGVSTIQQGVSGTTLTPIKVGLDSTDTADDVASKLADAVGNFADFNAGLSGNIVTVVNASSGVTTPDFPAPHVNTTPLTIITTIEGSNPGVTANILTVTNTSVGVANNATTGTMPGGFTIDSIIQGEDPGTTVDPSPPNFDQGIEIAIFETDLASDIAWKTATIINLLDDFNAGASGSKIIITNTDGGDATDASDVNTLFLFETTQQGSSGTIVTENSNFFFTEATSNYQYLLITRAGFDLQATDDPSIRETTYPFDKRLTGTIRTKSGLYEFDASEFSGWKLDDVVEEINLRAIPEVIAENKNGIMVIGNPPDQNNGQSFLLGGSLFENAGVDVTFLYGDFPPQCGMKIIVGRKNIEFVTEGGTLDVIVPEINAFLAINEILEVQATNTDNRLVIENTVGYKGVTFELADPSSVTTSMLALADIPAGIYSPDPTVFEYEINGEPPSPATGSPIAQVGFIDVYEWIKSPVPPQDWENYSASLTAPDAPTGTVLNPEDPSWVSVDTVLPSGGTETTYYFWVQRNTGRNVAKDYTTEEIRQRLDNPSSLGIPWFAPMDENHMLVYAANYRVVDGNAMEIIMDTREQETHFEWQLVAEGSLFQAIPQEIVDKIIDSMAGEDAQGNVVPDPKLAASERYGSFFFPRQTIFRDAETAKDVWLEAINTILKRRTFAAEPRLPTFFPVTLPDGLPVSDYWSKAWYNAEAYENEANYDDVPNVAARDERAAAGLYAVGDVVKVDTTEGADTEYRDLWDATQFVGARYVYTGDGWTVVGIENFTIELNDTLFTDDDFRDIYFIVYDIIDIGERNDLMFTMLYEMQRQSNPCDWFFKTSYIQSQMFANIGADPFVRANEFDAVIANINDIKPYRTKLRSDQVTTTLRDLEDFPVDIDEFPDKKITLIFDRLNCNAAEDGGWDGFPWDMEPLGYDVPLWEYEDMGRAEFYEAGRVVTNASDKSWTLYPDASPQLYPHKIELYLLDELVEEDSWPTEITVTKGPNTLTIETSQVLPVGYEIVAYLAWGFYCGSEPGLGVDLEDTLFQPTPSTYEHHVARRIGIDYPAYKFSTAQTKVFSGDGSTTTFIPGLDVDQEFAFVEVLVIEEQTLDDGYGGTITKGVAVRQEFGVDYTIPTPGTIEFAVPPPAPPVDYPGGNIYCYCSCNPNLDTQESLPQERIRATVIDSVNICVKTDNTPLYGAWDMAPWDTTPWDKEPVAESSSYRIMIGSEEIVAPGIEILPTSEDVTAGTTLYILGSSELYGITAVYVQPGGAGPFLPTIAGTHWDFVGSFQHVIEFDPAYGLNPGDVVRLVFGNWYVGVLGSFKITSTPVPLDYDNRNMIATSEPPANQTITVQYVKERRGFAPVSRLTTMEEIVTDIVDEIINPGNGSYDNTAFDGMRVIERNSAKIFVFNEATQMFVLTSSVVIGTQYLVTRTQEIIVYDGSSFNVIFQVGDSTPVPPVLDWPLYTPPAAPTPPPDFADGEIIPYGGYGVISGQIYLGTAPSAATQWPLSKQIVDASGPICTDFESPDYGVPEDLVICGYVPPIEPPEPPEPPVEPPEPPEDPTPCEEGCPAVSYKGIYVPGCCP